MDSYSDGEPATLNIPSLLAFAVISFFAIRYLFFKPSTTHAPHRSADASGVRGGGNRRQVEADKIETLATMFPQLRRRDIEWDLQNNGANVQASTERVLREGRLPPAPPNFQARDNGSASSSTAQRSPASSRSEPEKPKYSDLITRYGLSEKIAAQAAAAGATAEDDGEAIQTKAKQRGKGSWSVNKADRAALMKKRREDMVLAARRKMEERDKKGKDGIEA